jgi:hypothetical protein
MSIARRRSKIVSLRPSGDISEIQGHADTRRAIDVVAKSITRSKPASPVQGPSRGECLHRSRLHEDHRGSTRASFGDQPFDERTANSLFPYCLEGVHRLQFGPTRWEHFDRPDTHQSTVLSSAQYRHRYIQEAGNIEREHSFGRRYRFGECEMGAQQGLDIARSRILHGEVQGHNEVLASSGSVRQR